jgi:hypothetical protein
MFYILLVFLMGCTSLNYGLWSPPDNCEITSYRQSNGKLKYNVIGTNCIEIQQRLNKRTGDIEHD